MAKPSMIMWLGLSYNYVYIVTLYSDAPGLTLCRAAREQQQCVQSREKGEKCEQHAAKSEGKKYQTKDLESP